LANTDFDILDVRLLDKREDLVGQFDVVLCCENIEHIEDDHKLMVDMAKCLKERGILLLTAPNFHYRPMTAKDDGPFPSPEVGGHVRRGYTPEDLEELCRATELEILQIGYCSGFLSQKITGLLRKASTVNPLVGWLLVLPLRCLPPAMDRLISKSLDWPGYSITLVAKKTCAQTHPGFESHPPAMKMRV
jgi:SAM-dependent methyltransferase